MKKWLATRPRRTSTCRTTYPSSSQPTINLCPVSGCIRRQRKKKKRMPHRGRKRKKSRTHVPLEGEKTKNSTPAAALQTGHASAAASKTPKSLVIKHGGSTSPEVSTMVEDMRRLMLPYTALHFQEDAKNRKLTLSQYAKHLAMPLGITHILAFSQTRSKPQQENGSGPMVDVVSDRLNLRLARVPEGPTLSFRVHAFSLAKDIKKVQRRPISDATNSLHNHPPIVVTNNFGGSQNRESAGASLSSRKSRGVDDSDVPPHVKLMRIVGCLRDGSDDDNYLCLISLLSPDFSKLVSLPQCSDCQACRLSASRTLQFGGGASCRKRR
jgi:Brix domain